MANVSRTPTESVSTGTKRTMEPAAALELIDSGKTIPKELAAKILSSVRPVTPRQAEEIAKGFEEKTGIPAQEAKRHLKIVSREWITPSIRFKPVWTLHNDVSYCAIQIQEASQEGGVAQPEQPTMLIVTSEGKTLYREDLGLLGLQVDDNWDEETVGWSPPSVKKFLDGAEPLLPADLFRRQPTREPPREPDFVAGNLNMQAHFTALPAGKADIASDFTPSLRHVSMSPANLPATMY